MSKNINIKNIQNASENIEHGLMKRRESIKNGRDCPTTSIREKGQSYILNMFLKEKRV